MVLGGRKEKNPLRKFFRLSSVVPLGSYWPRCWLSEDKAPCAHYFQAPATQASEEENFIVNKTDWSFLKTKIQIKSTFYEASLYFIFSVYKYC